MHLLPLVSLEFLVPFSMAFGLEYRVCLGDFVVPLTKEELELKDLHELLSGDEEPQDFLLLSLKVSNPHPSMLWLTKALELPGPWWTKHAGSLAILEDLKKEILSKRPKSARMPKDAKAIVALQVRDRVILAKNSLLPVVLAFRPGTELQELEWFLREVEKDAKNLNTAEPPPKQAKLDVDPEEQEIIEECTRDLKSQYGCLQAVFLPSRSVIKVTRKDKRTSEFCVLGLKKKRQEAIITAGPQAWEPVRNVFEEAFGKAQKFLSHQEDQPAPLQLPGGSSAVAPVVPPLVDEPADAPVVPPLVDEPSL